MKHVNTLTKALIPLLLLLAEYTAKAQSFSGTYVVGPGQAYTSLSNASTGIIPKMITNGVSGPVTILIMPGAYSGADWQANIPAIPGVSAVNTVTLKPQTTYGSVTLSFAGTSTGTCSGTPASYTGNNYVIRFNSCSYITVQDLILSNTATSTTYGTVIDFQGCSTNPNTASYNTVIGCKLMGTLTTASTTVSSARVYANYHTGTNNTITNDSIICNGYGAYWYGLNTTTFSANTSFTNNTIRGIGTTNIAPSFYTLYTSGLKINNNNILTNASVASTYYGVYYDFAMNAPEIMNNNISINGTTTAYGIYGIYSADMKINNNVITHLGTGALYAIYPNGNTTYPHTNTQIIGNTITKTGLTGTMYGIYTNYGYGKQEIRNNTITYTGNSSASIIGMYGNYAQGTATNYQGITGNIITVTNTSTAQGINWYYGNYDSIANNVITFNNTTGTMQPLYHYNSSYIPTQGNGNVLFNNTFSATATSSSAATLYFGYYQRKMVFAKNNINVRLTTGSITQYNYYCDSITFRDNTIYDSTSGSMTLYHAMYGDPAITYSYGGNTFSKNNIRVISAGSQPINHYFGYYHQQQKVDSNIIYLKSNGSYVYNYMGYVGGGAATLRGNDIYLYAGANYAFNYMVYDNVGHSAPYIVDRNKVVIDLQGSAYGYNYLYNYNYGPLIFSNNDILVKAVNPSAYVQALYWPQPGNLEFFNNKVHLNVTGTPSGTYCNTGLLNYYATGACNYYNNTFVTTGNSNALFCAVAETNVNYGGIMTFRNNIFRREGGTNNGYPFVTMDQSNVYQKGDYNNYSGGAAPIAHTNGSIMTTSYIAPTAVPTLAAWRAATNQQHNSLVYDPGLTDVANNDLRPNPNNPNSWAVQGRGVHIPGNNMDLLGNSRALLPGAGVPDIGAYEFTPVVPAPFATATPATPAPATTQVFTFGEDTVGTITWGAVAPASVFYKKYTGVQPPANFLAFNATAMYFYDSIGVTGTFDAYTSRNYYKDPWIGTIAAESSLHLAKDSTMLPGHWKGYPFSQSNPNTTRNFINTTGLVSFGYYSGMDIPNNAGTVDIVDPSGTFCAGTYTVRVKIANNGNNIINNVKVNWQIPPAAPTQIPYNTPIPVYNGTPGSNEAIITLGNFPITPAGTTFKVWTELPNGVLDQATVDDTITKMVRSAFSGLFTIGGTAPDFPTVTAAVTALKAFGVCGPTTFVIRPGTYTGRYDLGGVAGMTAVNRVTFMGDPVTNGNRNTVTLTFASTSAADQEIFKMNNASFFTIKNIGIMNTGASSWSIGVSYYGAPSYDSVVDCNISVGSLLTTYVCPIMAYSGWITGEQFGNVIMNNTLNSGYWSICWYGSTASYATNMVINNNTATGYGPYGYYLQYSRAMRLENNKIRNTYTSASYGLYMIYVDRDPQVNGNDVVWPLNYGCYLTYFNQTGSVGRASMKNNMFSSPGTSYGHIIQYLNRTDVTNNTFINKTGSTSAVYFYIGNSTAYRDNTFRNNIIAQFQGSGAAAYIYDNPATYNNQWNYNLFYTTSTSQLMSGSYAAANLAAWTTATGMDRNSLVYRPGIDTITGVPDLNDPRSWAMNNRGVQIAGNNVDMLGNARIDQLVNGAPDMGAYEFEPNVQPPLATATPTAAVPGGTQLFMFGTDTVARVAWSNTLLLTSPLEVRRYHGRIAPGFLSISPNRYMYFYTDIRPTAPGTTYMFNTDVYYLDIWNGRINNEAGLMLTHKSPTTPSWIIYNQGASSVNTSRNILYGASLMNFGVFTGIDTQVVFSAIATALGSTVFCTGGNVVLSANTGINYTYQWYRNGSPINGATNSTYTATQGGDYYVVIVSTVGSTTYTATSVTITVSVMAPPMALTTASGTLTYCSGTNLSLGVSTAPGQTYRWFLNGIPAPGTNTNPNYVVGAAGTYTVQVSNIGCTTTSLPMVVTPGPLVVNLGPDITGCEVKNQAYILDAGHPGAKFSWSTGDTTQKIYITKTAGPQNYTVTVDAGGAGCIASDQVSVNIRPLPSITGISYIQSGTTYIFTASGAQNVSTYHWIFNDQGTMKHDYTPAPAPVHFSASMVATLIVCNECGCDTINIVNWATGINTGGKGSFNVSLFPNPASDKVTFAIEGTPRIKDITVVNSLGEVVYKETLNGEQTKEVDVTKLAQGHYLLRATTNEGTITKPFNIVR